MKNSIANYIIIGLKGSKGGREELTSRRKDSQLDLFVAGPAMSQSAEFARVHRGRRLLTRRTCAVVNNKLSSESDVVHVWKLLPLLLPLRSCCEML
jgi:hypothetical protein